MKNNLATIDKLKRGKTIDTKRINGALKCTIKAHGPITMVLMVLLVNVYMVVY
jgi:hypothetical protein